MDIIQLPISLQVELKLHLNQDLISNVKLFNLGSPEFILETVKYLYPKICMKGDIVIWYGEIADDMYFIKKGKVQIITECHTRVIAIQEEGSYFGEIGLLLTGKRTCIVQAIENCIFMCLKKEHFNMIMAQFPDQRNHLLKVSKQRLQTTKAQDLPQDKIIEKIEFEEDEKEDNVPISVVNLFISNLSVTNVNNAHNANNDSRQQNKIPKKNGFFNSMIQTIDEENKPKNIDISVQEVAEKTPQPLPSEIAQNINNGSGLNNLSGFQQQAPLKDRSLYLNTFKQRAYTNFLKRSNAVKKSFTLPSSKIFSQLTKGSTFQKLWRVVISIVISYNFFFVPLSIAFSIDLDNSYAFIEYLNYIIYFIDIFVYSYSVQEEKNKNLINTVQVSSKQVLPEYNSIQFDQTNLNNNNKSTNVINRSALHSLVQSNFDVNSSKQIIKNKEKTGLSRFNYRKVVDNYFKRIVLILDIFSTFPIDILLLFLQVNPVLCRVTRLSRLTRVIRLKDLYSSLNNRLQWNRGYFYLKMFIVVTYLNHLFACMFYILAYNELGSVTPNLFTNFDSNTIPQRVPLYNQDNWAQYFCFLYYALNLTSQGSFGTMQAMSLGERSVQSIVILVFRILAIVFVAQALNSEKMDKTLSNEAKSKMESMRMFLDYKEFPKTLMNRIYKFYDYQQIKFKGIDDEEILSELPHTVQNEIILSLFQNVLKKIQTNDTKDQGVVLTLMRMMKQKIVPKDEYVFKKGEIAAEMFFIIEGQAIVMIEDDFHLKPPVILAQLKEGDYFGEMAILDAEINTRGASIIAETNLHLASLNIQDFRTVCQLYPDIHQIIQKFAIKRRIKTQKTIESKSSKSNRKIEMKEERQGNESQEEEGKVHRDFEDQGYLHHKDQQETDGFQLKQTDEEKSPNIISQTSGIKQTQPYFLEKSDKFMLSGLHNSKQNNEESNFNSNNATNINSLQPNQINNNSNNNNQTSNLIFKHRKSLLGPQMYNNNNSPINNNFFEFQIEQIEDYMSKYSKNYVDMKDQELSSQIGQDILSIDKKFSSQHENENDISGQPQTIPTNKLQSGLLSPQQDQIAKVKNDFLNYIRSQSKKNTLKQSQIKSQPYFKDYDNEIEDDFNNLRNNLQEFPTNNMKKQRKKQRTLFLKEKEIDNIFNENINNKQNVQTQNTTLKGNNILNSKTQSTKIIDLVDGDDNHQMIQPDNKDPNVEHQDNQSEQTSTIKKDDWTMSSNTNIQSNHQQPDDQQTISDKLLHQKPKRRSAYERDLEEDTIGDGDIIFTQPEQMQTTPKIFVQQQENRLSTHQDYNHNTPQTPDNNNQEGFNLLSNNKRNHLFANGHRHNKEENGSHNIFLSPQYNIEKPSQLQKSQEIQPNYNSKYFSFGGDVSKSQNMSQQHSMNLQLSKKKTAKIDSSEASYFKNLHDQPSVFQQSQLQYPASQFHSKQFQKRRSHSAEILLKHSNQLDTQLYSQESSTHINADKKKKNRDELFQSEKLQNYGNQGDRILEIKNNSEKSSSSLSSSNVSFNKIEKNHTFTIKKTDLNFKTSSLILYSSIALKTMGSFMSNHFFALRRQSIVMIIVSMYSCFVIPLNLAFDASFSFLKNIPLLIVEILVTIILFIFTIQEFRRTQIKLQKIKQKKFKGRLIDIYDQYTAMKRIYQNKLLINIAISIPFALIFDLAEVDSSRTNIVLIILSLNRFLCLYNIYYAISYYDSKQQQYIELIKLFVIIGFLNHLNACIWVSIGKQEQNWNNCWFKRIQTTLISQEEIIKFDITDFSLYLNALDWAYQILTHTAIGDSSAVNTREEVYSCVILILTILFSIHFFASLSSLIKVLSSSLKRDFIMKYKLVVAFIKKMGLKQFKPYVEIYFSYLWESMLGVDENKFVNEFPNNLRADIIEHMYSRLIKYSIFFNSGPRWRNEQIKLSVLRFMSFEVFMPNELIIVAGEVCHDVYIIFEGQVESYNFELYKMITMSPGDFFGGILNDKPKRARQPAYIKAAKICKVGRIGSTEFQSIALAFPEWFSRIEEIQSERYNTQMKSLQYFRKIKKHKAPQKSELFNDVQSEKNHVRHSLKTVKKSEEFEITDDLVQKYKNLKIHFQSYGDQDTTHVQSSGGVGAQRGESQFEVNFQSDIDKSSGIEHKQISTNRSHKKPKINQVIPQSNIPVDGNLQEPQSNNHNGVSQKRNEFQEFIQKRIQQSQSQLNSQQLDAKSQKKRLLLHMQSQLNSNLVILKSRKTDKFQVVNLPHDEKEPEEMQVADPVQFSFQTASNEEIYFVIASWRNVYNLVKNSNRRIKFFLHPTGDLKLLLDYIYMILISIYLLYLPLTVGFMSSFNKDVVIVFEVAYMITSFFHVFIHLKTPPYSGGSINPDQKLIYKIYIQSFQAVYDFITIVPLNFIVFLLKYNNYIESLPYASQILLDISRLFPLLHYNYLFTQFNKLDSSMRGFSIVFNIVKHVFFISSVVNIITCAWAWVNTFGQQFETETWMIHFKIANSPFYIQYLYCVYFTLNTISTAGYPQMVVFTNLERMAFNIMILVGYTIYAGIFGLQINQQQSLDLKLHDLYINMETIYNLMETSNAPKGLKKRVDIYFTYVTETNMNDIEEITKIKGMIPNMMYKSILYNQTKTNLNSFKVFKDLKNAYLIRTISQVLRQEIFLEGDYIVRKDEYGNQMFFLISGKVQVVSDNELQVLKTIQPGEFFGEVSLFTDNYKRIASVIAQTVVHVYSIKKADVQPIFQAFPDFKNYIYNQASLRMKDTRRTLANQNLFQRQLFNKQSTIIHGDHQINLKKQKLPNLLFNAMQVDQELSRYHTNSLKQIKNKNEPIKQAIVITNMSNKSNTKNNNADGASKISKMDTKSSQKKDSTKKKLSKTIHLRKRFEEDLEQNNEEVEKLINEGPQDNISEVDLDVSLIPQEQNFSQFYNKGGLNNIFKVQKIEVLSAPFKEEENKPLQSLRHKRSKPKSKRYTDNIESSEISDNEGSGDETVIEQIEDIEEYYQKFVKNHQQDMREFVSFHDLVNENEMDFNNIPDLQSRRRLGAGRKHERRLSRINLKKQIKLSRQSEMRLQWGMNLEYN